MQAVYIKKILKKRYGLNDEYLFNIEVEKWGMKCIDYIKQGKEFDIACREAARDVFKTYGQNPFSVEKSLESQTTLFLMEYIKNLSGAGK